MKTENARYCRRPAMGDRLENSRHGVVTVTGIRHQGRVLTVRDQLNRLWTVERAPAGWWLKTPAGDPVATVDPADPWGDALDADPVAEVEPAPFPVPVDAPDPVEVAARTWRGIDRGFRCTACGTLTIYGGGQMTVDGGEELCNRCDAARIDAHWHARPAGVSAVRITSADGSSTVGGAFTHKPYPYPSDVPPSVRWGLIASAGGSHGCPATRTRRLIGQRVRAALREVYGLSFTAPEYAGHDAAERDDRDPDTRARDYLCAYAGQLIDRDDVEPVERLALAYTTSDADQVAAGVRPAVGTVVTLTPGTVWHVIERSSTEARRFPFSTRVQQDGHPFNASVPLAAVTVAETHGGHVARTAR